MLCIHNSIIIGLENMFCLTLYSKKCNKSYLNLVNSHIFMYMKLYIDHRCVFSYQWLFTLSPLCHNPHTCTLEEKRTKSANNNRIFVSYLHISYRLVFNTKYPIMRVFISMLYFSAFKITCRVSNESRAWILSLLIMHHHIC